MSVTFVDIASASGAYRPEYARLLAVAQTVAPVGDAVQSDDVREWLRIDSDDTSNDSVIQMIMASAVEAVQSAANKSMLTRTLRATFDIGVKAELPYGPTVQITLVERQDTLGAWTATTDYTYFGAQYIAFSSDGVYRVTYTAGHGTTHDTVPSNLKLAALRYIKAHYEYREGVIIGSTSSEMKGFTWRDALQPSKAYTL